ncbi:MAG: formimidoylglutamase [Chitinophagaceae bacterium]
MATYQPPQPWQGRNDGDEAAVQRWHQAINLINADELTNQPINQSTKIALIGFCSDEGVRRNHGRVGAKNAPAAIRKACSNFPVHFDKIVLYDAGDVTCDDGHLEAAQVLLGEKIYALISHKFFPIVLGGGHEVAYANFSGIQQRLKPKASFGVINFDAHFDLRYVDDNVGATSGTGFWQMAQMVKNQQSNFEYLAIGIQQCSNTKKLFETAEDIEALHVLAEEFTNDQLEHLLHLINGVLHASSMVQLSIDMDVFTAANSPGVSAPSFNGIPPNSMFKRLLRHIVFSGKLASIDIAEVNPLYDVDNRTSRLAASFIFDIVQALERG